MTRSTRAPRRALLAAAVAGALALAACGSGSAGSVADTPSTSASPGSVGSSKAPGPVPSASEAPLSPSASPAPAGTSLTITVRGSTVTPAPASVDVRAGTPVHLVITADRDSQVHVHVADLERPITAGTPLTIDFTPQQQGVYEVELHDPDLLLVKLAVR